MRQFDGNNISSLGKIEFMMHRHKRQLNVSFYSQIDTYDVYLLFINTFLLNV